MFCSVFNRLALAAAKVCEFSGVFVLAVAGIYRSRAVFLLVSAFAGANLFSEFAHPLQMAAVELSRAP